MTPHLWQQNLRFLFFSQVSFCGWMCHKVFNRSFGVVVVWHQILWSYSLHQQLLWFYCSKSSNTSLSKYSNTSKSPAFKTLLKGMILFIWVWVKYEDSRPPAACLWCTSGESRPSVSGFLSVFAERKEESAASAETWREDRCRHMWCRFGGDSQMATRQDARDAGWLLSVHTGMQLQLIHMYVCIRMYAAVHRVSCSYTHVSQILVWNMKYM